MIQLEIGIVEVQPQMVLGMRKKGKYEEIRMMLPEVWQFAVERGIRIEGLPIFFHEMTDEAAKKADAEGNADIEVVVPVSGKVEWRVLARPSAMSCLAGKWRRLSTRDHIRNWSSRMKNGTVQKSSDSQISQFIA